MTDGKGYLLPKFLYGLSLSKQYTGFRTMINFSQRNIVSFFEEWPSLYNDNNNDNNNNDNRCKKGKLTCKGLMENAIVRGYCSKMTLTNKHNALYSGSNVFSETLRQGVFDSVRAQCCSIYKR